MTTAMDDNSGSESELDDWEDWTESEEKAADFLCLFCDETFPTSTQAFSHLTVSHSFDFCSLQKQGRWDFYESIRVINYIRAEVAAGKCIFCGESFQAKGQLASHMAEVEHFCLPVRESVPWMDDVYLRPVLPNDGLLCELEEEFPARELEEEVKELSITQPTRGLVERARLDLPPLNSGNIVTNGGDMSNRGEELESLIQSLRRENEDLRLELATSSFSFSALESREDVNGWALHPPARNAGERHEGRRQQDEECSARGEKLVGETDVGDGGSEKVSRERRLSCLKQSGGKGLTKKVSFSSVAEKERRAIDSSYFGSYSGFGIHREMLGDRVRTQAYQDAIEGNPSLFGKAVVMDVGAGTGILSLFAARAGAQKVVSIDGSAKMVSVARHVAADNGLLSSSHSQAERELVKESSGGDGVITFVNGMMEELGDELTVQEHSVDVIISEWMGYCLLFESMLDSVIHARDKWLRPGGALLPDTAIMYIAGIGKGGTSLPFWEKVYGFDMSFIGKELVKDAAQVPIIDVVGSEHVITPPHTLRHMDLVSISADQVEFTADFQLQLLHAGGDGKNSADEAGESSPVFCYGVVVWFDVGFTERFCKEKPVVMSTSPHTPPTHWSQTILTFREPIALVPVQAAECASSCSCPGKKGGEDSESVVGTSTSPAVSVTGRFSLVRSSRHRSIDISLETTAVGASGNSRAFPAQLFDL